MISAFTATLMIGIVYLNGKFKQFGKIITQVNYFLRQTLLSCFPAMDESDKAPDRKSRRIRSHDVQGLRYFKSINGLLQLFHQFGTERGKAHSRQLHMDQYCMLVERTLEPDRLYVMDRGCQKWGLWNANYIKAGSYICRARNKSIVPSSPVR